MPDKPDKFDPYREALVLEETTVWPPEADALPEDRRLHFERVLHGQARLCAELRYFRLHTGFARQITVTGADLARLGVDLPATPSEAP